MIGFSFKAPAKDVLQKELLVNWIRLDKHFKSALQLAGHDIYLEVHSIWFHLCILKYSIML